MSVRLVVAKYKESVEWTKSIKHAVTIYDKSDSPLEGSVPLKNIGREGETFLHHIVTHYDALDDVTVFLQGNPFEHLQLLVGWRARLTPEEQARVCEKVNNEITSESPFSSFYQVRYNDPNGTNGANIKSTCKKYYGVEYDWFTVVPGAQYIVPKSYILSRPLSFWKSLRDGFHSGDLNGYAQEQLWWLAYRHSMDYTNVRDHDIEKAKVLNNLYGFHNTPTSIYFA
jgi:hypothetical protein